MNPKVAAIIAAYNEEKTVGEVVRVIAESHLCDEIIVISDGSTDGTAAQAREAGATMVHELPIKGGKGGAILHGVTHTDAPVLIFLDADLYGLKKEHLEIILKPVLDGSKVMNVALRDRGGLMMKISSYLPLIGGERALLRHVIEGVPPKFLRGFMLEAALNYYCRKEKLPYGSDLCFGLSMRRKMEKVGFWKGLLEYVEMFYQVFKAMIVVRIAHWRGEF